MNREDLKRIIKNQICDNCRFCALGNNNKEQCLSAAESGLATHSYPLPKDRTCSKWQKIIDMKLNTYSVNSRPRKLKIKWTKETELDIPALSADIEEKLVKQAAKEISNE